MRALAKGEQVPELPMTADALTQKQNRKNAEIKREQKALKKVKAPIVPVKSNISVGLDPNSLAARRLAMKNGTQLPEATTNTSQNDVSFDADFSSAPAFVDDSFEAAGANFAHFDNSVPLDFFSTGPSAAAAATFDPFTDNSKPTSQPVVFDPFTVPQSASSFDPFACPPVVAGSSLDSISDRLDVSSGVVRPPLVRGSSTPLARGSFNQDSSAIL